MNILDQIIEVKKKELQKRKIEMPIQELEKMPLYSSPSYSLKRFLLDNSRTGIIAEFKRKSPSKGIINDKAKVLDVTSAYANNGASGVSILTDNHFFGGSIDDLISARINEIPILRKDFIIDEYQVMETKAIGADVLLLIAAILEPEQVKELTLKAHELGLEVILEIHTEEELKHVNDSVDIIGINNRDLKTFEVNIENSIHLSRYLPKNKIRIAESGIHSLKEITFLRNSGFHGFLMGENFMKAADPALAFMNFVSGLNDTV